VKDLCHLQIQGVNQLQKEIEEISNARRELSLDPQAIHINEQTMELEGYDIIKEHHEPFVALLKSQDGTESENASVQKSGAHKKHTHLNFRPREVNEMIEDHIEPKELF